MKKYILTIILLIFALVTRGQSPATPALLKDEDPSSLLIGVSGGLSVPLGDYATAVNLGHLFTANMEYSFNNSFGIMINGEMLTHNLRPFPSTGGYSYLNNYQFDFKTYLYMGGFYFSAFSSDDDEKALAVNVKLMAGYMNIYFEGRDENEALLNTVNHLIAGCGLGLEFRKPCSKRVALIFNVEYLRPFSTNDIPFIVVNGTAGIGLTLN